LCFFFQAEDGIRDFHVTGVQTCALPILAQEAVRAPLLEAYLHDEPGLDPARIGNRLRLARRRPLLRGSQALGHGGELALAEAAEIGRASCRERVEDPADAASCKKKQQGR